MDTRGKTNAEFRNDVTTTLARHEASFDQVNAALQAVLTELQALRHSRNPSSSQPDTNPFAPEETSRSNAVNERSIHHELPHHRLRLDFPRFNGEDPTGWVYKAEQYFDFKDISPDQQVQLASFHLEGIALQWHRWLTKFRGPLTWKEFTKAVHLRFGPTDYEDPSEALTRLKQTSSVAAYQEAFERLSHRVDGLPKNFLIGCFVAGLRDDIRLDVKIKQPRTLSDTIGVARLIEERNQLQRKPTQAACSQSTVITQRPRLNPTAGVLGPPPNQRPNQNPVTPPATFRRITNQEARERRERGLCYYCDEKFTPGHRCERPQLFMIEDLPYLGSEDVNGVQFEQDTQETIPEISFHAMAGTEHTQTLRVSGKLKNKEVTVLIDGGSTHNFIDQSIVSKFGLPVVRDKKLQVMVANREKIECVGQCQALTLIIHALQEEVHRDSFYKDLLEKSPPQSRHQLYQRDGVWFKRNRIYLSPTSTLIPKIMADCHSSPICGHFGFHKTLSRIKHNFLWSNMCRWKTPPGRMNGVSPSHFLILSLMTRILERGGMIRAITHGAMQAIIHAIIHGAMHARVTFSCGFCSIIP